MTLFSDSAMTALLNRSLVGGAVILVIFLLCLCMKAFPRKYVCLLWLIPFGRLLFPFSISAPFSLLPLPPEPITEAALELEEYGISGVMPYFDTGLDSLDAAVNQILWVTMKPSPATSADPAQINLWIFQIVWLGGMGVFILLHFIRYFCLKYSLRDSIPAAKDEARMGEKALCGVYFSDRISMPIVAGIIRPKIYLPFSLEKEEAANEREMILAHEDAHRKRGDHLVKLFAFAALAVHWFNPLVWAAYFRYCHDVEMACDERAMETLGIEKKKEYSLTLLRFEEKRSSLLIPLAFGESPTKSRIRHILNYKKPQFWLGMAALVILVSAALTLFTNPEKNSESISIIGGADGPTSIFLAGKPGNEENSGNASSPAALLDPETIGEMPFGIQVELDWVSANKISLHGNFGYLSFSLSGGNSPKKAELAAAFTLEEAGPIVMQGASYTEVVGGEDSALVVTNPYNPQGEAELFWYMENGNQIQSVPESVQEDFLLHGRDGAFRDAVLNSELMTVLAEKVNSLYGSELLYGPVAIPETGSNVYGFLAASGDKVKDIWYGIWQETGDSITQVPLFQSN